MTNAHGRDWEEIWRFWQRVDIRESDECWEWKLGRDESGYGIWYSRGRKHRAHRWLLGFIRGAPLIGAQHGIEDACHRCANPPCCNPNHLYVGTRKQNIADAVASGSLWMQKRTHCPQGHPYEGDNLYVNPSGSRKCRTCRREAAIAQGVRRMERRRAEGRRAWPETRRAAHRPSNLA